MFASTRKFSYTVSVAEHFSGGSESRSTSVSMIQILQGNFST